MDKGAPPSQRNSKPSAPGHRHFAVVPTLDAGSRRLSVQQLVMNAHHAIDTLVIDRRLNLETPARFATACRAFHLAHLWKALRTSLVAVALMAEAGF